MDKFIFNNRRMPKARNEIISGMAGVTSINSCVSLFKRLGILPLPHEGVFPLWNFTINNQGDYQAN
jgi:hypothetical protein